MEITEVIGQLQDIGRVLPAQNIPTLLLYQGSPNSPLKGHFPNWAKRL